ncbi:YafY family protein [Mangrovimonas sp. DI 80]|uniref:helix-turn-helix transcriptional regulator n=1 Tax=Mangrovimonas sp. DI 80 TaxID=1779330 RepID=UPI000975B98A|nr:WYL domain-containing protein [Mangrovimonas sp. DI 80]OMP32288.1 hypothetical protein BKM32_04345 [Mangrovimonas sp. DI 80]
MSTATIRHLRILKLLENNEFLTIPMVEFEYQKKGIKYGKSQFYRDIDFLRNRGYYIKNDNNGSFTLDRDLTKDYDFLSHYFKHLAITALCEQAVELDPDFLRYIQFERNSNTVSNFSIFTNIFEAICNKCSISFSHHSFYHKGKVEEYKLSPYFLKEYKNRWYVVGETKKGIRAFGLDRVSRLVVNDEVVPSKFERAMEVFENTVGLNHSEHDLGLIRLSVDSSQRPYLESLPIHSTQKIYEDENGRFELTLFVKYNFELRQELLKYGSYLKVLEPEWIRDDFRNELKKTLDLY